MRQYILPLVVVSAFGCSGAQGDEVESFASAPEGLVSCPTVGAQDGQMRAAATVAFSLMKLAGVASAGQTKALQAYSVLASQRYRIMSGNAGIEFDPTDPLYSHVTNPMKAELAFAQLDSTVAKFLVDGLSYAYSHTNGKVYPSIPSVQVLAGYKYPGPTTAAVLDHDNNSDMATITGQLWCGTSMVTIAQTCRNTGDFSPLISHVITEWRAGPPTAFKGTVTMPTSPFNGPSSSGNPYLVVSVNGKATNWATYDFAGADCYLRPNNTCTAQLQIDPIPYAEPGDYYTSAGLMGAQSNPFALSNTVLYADPAHAKQWATRVANSVQEWGTFSTQVTVFGATKYKYQKVY